MWEVLVNHRRRTTMEFQVENAIKLNNLISETFILLRNIYNPVDTMNIYSSTNL